MDILPNLRQGILNEKHFTILHFFELIYQFENEETILRCMKSITDVGSFGVTGAQYEKMDTNQWIGDYEEVDGFHYVDKTPAIYFSVGDEFNPEEIIIPVFMAYHYFKTVMLDFLEIYPQSRAGFKEILLKYPK